MFNENVRVLDCTVRDGGLMNKWQFSDEFVKGFMTHVSKLVSIIWRSVTGVVRRLFQGVKWDHGNFVTIRISGGSLEMENLR